MVRPQIHPTTVWVETREVAPVDIISNNITPTHRDSILVKKLRQFLNNLNNEEKDLCHSYLILLSISFSPELFIIHSFKQTAILIRV